MRIHLEKNISQHTNTIPLSFGDVQNFHEMLRKSIYFKNNFNV